MTKKAILGYTVGFLGVILMSAPEAFARGTGTATTLRQGVKQGTRTAPKAPGAVRRAAPTAGEAAAATKTAGEAAQTGEAAESGQAVAPLSVRTATTSTIDASALAAEMEKVEEHLVGLAANEAQTFRDGLETHFFQPDKIGGCIAKLNMDQRSKLAQVSDDGIRELLSRGQGRSIFAVGEEDVDAIAEAFTLDAARTLGWQKAEVAGNVSTLVDSCMISAPVKDQDGVQAALRTM